jgi:DNA polymerase I-like protein with 3'-5' exonuclease and polymerase domains
MRVLTLDTETTTQNNGDSFNPNNQLCTLGMLTEQGEYSDYLIEYNEEPYGTKLQTIQQAVDSADMLVLFNAKFDLHWLRRYNISFVNKRIWDCQLVHFILNNQQVPYPSLNDVAASHDLGQKIDVIKNEYWRKGIDTPNIPLEILLEYQKQDVDLTYQIYLKQVGLVEERQIKALCLLHNMDLLMLEEMEWNGMFYDSEESIKEGDTVEQQIELLDVSIKRYYPECNLNLSSPDHISAILYGGVVRWKEREEFLFTYKDEKKEPVWKSKIVEK